MHRPFAEEDSGAGRGDEVVREQVRRPGRRVPTEVRDDPPDLGEQRLGNDVRRWPVRDAAAVREDDDAVGEPSGKIEVMKRRDRRDVAAFGQVSNASEQVELVADVEVGGRFVEEEDRCRLGERTPEDCPLALSAAQGEDSVVRPVREPDLVEDAGRDRAVVRGLRVERAMVGESAVEHVIEKPDVVARALALGDPRDRPSPLEHGKRADRSPQHLDLSFDGSEETQNGAQQGRLPRAVRPGQGHELSGADGEIDLAQGRPGSVSDRHAGQAYGRRILGDVHVDPMVDAPRWR